MCQTLLNRINTQLSEDAIIGLGGNTGKEYLLLNIVQCWHASEVDEDNWYLSVVLYC